MDITLREYRAFGAVYVEESGRSSSSVERTDTEKKVNTYTVVSGDSLWKIAKQYLWRRKAGGKRFLMPTKIK